MPDLYERHLVEDERRMLHRPKSDYIETGRGEECRNSSSLVVDDLVEDLIVTRPKPTVKKELEKAPQVEVVAGTAFSEIERILSSEFRVQAVPPPIGI